MTTQAGKYHVPLRVYGTLVLLVMVACLAANGDGTSASKLRWRDPLLIALAYAPIDSICASECSVVELDSTVRAAPSREHFDVLSQPTLGLLDRDSAAVALGAPRLMIAAFSARAATRDTVRLATSIFIGEPRNSDTRVIISVVPPHSIGVIIAVDLTLSNDKWKISHVRAYEG